MVRAHRSQRRRTRQRDRGEGGLHRTGGRTLATTALRTKPKQRESQRKSNTAYLWTSRSYRIHPFCSAASRLVLIFCKNVLKPNQVYIKKSLNFCTLRLFLLLNGTSAHSKFPIEHIILYQLRNLYFHLEHLFRPEIILY
jgi:hypothetical protein